MAPDGDVLTKSQAARRQRVLVAALQLGAEGGYDAVQMRDVAATADTAEVKGGQGRGPLSGDA